MNGDLPAAVWLDGALVAPDDARVSALDHGLTVGDGVFETMRVYGGTPFALRRHLDRLDDSGAGLGLDVPVRAVLERACREVVARAGLADARLRLTVTGGPGPPGTGRGAAAPTVLATAGPMADVASTAAVGVCPWTRNERSAVTGLKTTSYAENVVAMAWALEREADEAVFANTAGALCEGTGTNVFVAHEGRLVTPSLGSGCLAGVTRALVLELTGAEEADLPLDALAGAEEAFLTSSTREVQPIAKVDGRALPACPGPLTAAARSAFRDLVARDPDP